MAQKQDGRLSAGMVRSTIRMLIPLHKQIEALDILRSISTQTRFEPGCISSRLYNGADEIRAIMIEELWTSQEELDRHLRSFDYRSVLLVVEMAERPPEIRFSAISNSSGIETIEKARSHMG